jgi:hypothetical protein
MMMRSIKPQEIIPFYSAIRQRAGLLPSAEKYEPRNPSVKNFPEIWSGSGKEPCQVTDIDDSNILSGQNALHALID